MTTARRLTPTRLRLLKLVATSEWPVHVYPQWDDVTGLPGISAVDVDAVVELGLVTLVEMDPRRPKFARVELTESGRLIEMEKDGELE